MRIPIETRRKMLAVVKRVEPVLQVARRFEVSERGLHNLLKRRRNCMIARRFVAPERFVFLDESSAKTNMTRLCGRSPIGERCNIFAAHGHWKTTTMIRAIRHSGVIPEATLLIDGPMNSDTFLGYIEHCLAPTLNPGDIVAMDNLSAHKAMADTPARLIRAAGDAFQAVSPHECRNYFTSCRYGI